LWQLLVHGHHGGGDRVWPSTREPDSGCSSADMFSSHDATRTADSKNKIEDAPSFLGSTDSQAPRSQADGKVARAVRSHEQTESVDKPGIGADAHGADGGFPGGSLKSLAAYVSTPAVVRPPARLPAFCLLPKPTHNLFKTWRLAFLETKSCSIGGLKRHRPPVQYATPFTYHTTSLERPSRLLVLLTCVPRPGAARPTASEPAATSNNQYPGTSTCPPRYRQVLPLPLLRRCSSAPQGGEADGWMPGRSVKRGTEATRDLNVPCC